VVSLLIPKYMGYAIKTILLFIEWLTTKYCGQALNGIVNAVTSQRVTTTDNRGITTTTNNAFQPIEGNSSTGIRMSLNRDFNVGSAPVTTTDRNGNPVYASINPTNVTINTNGAFY